MFINYSVVSERTGRETVIQDFSNPLLPTTFKTRYYPRPDDAGVFRVVRAVIIFVHLVVVVVVVEDDNY